MQKHGVVYPLLGIHSFEANGTVFRPQEADCNPKKRPRNSFSYLLSQFGLDISVSFNTRPTLKDNLQEV